MAISSTWSPFEGRLADALGALDEDQFLVISEKRGSVYLQFAAQGAFGLRAEAVSNHYLPPDHQLTTDQVAALEALGWKPPTGSRRESTPQRQPDGSPNFFRDFDRPVPFGDVARLAVRTLAEVMQIPHPGHMEYQAFDVDHRSILLPTLGLKNRRAVPAPAAPKADSVEHVRLRVLESLREMMGDDDLEFSDAGHIPLHFGSALVLVRVHADPLCVSVVSPVLVHVEAGELLMDRLNELNAKVRFARLFLKDGVVFAAVEVNATPLTPQHVVDACAQLGRLADDIDDMLQDEFGGRTAGGEFRAKLVVH